MIADLKGEQMLAQICCVKKSNVEKAGGAAGRPGR